MKINTRFLKPLTIIVGLLAVQFTFAQCPVITCPGNQTVNNTPGTCGAVVNYVTPVGANPCGGGPTTFTYTGVAQNYTVPAGVTTITIDAFGAQGGTYGNFTGGLGARIKGNVSVTPGQVLLVYVGAQGIPSQNAGGGGGGSGVSNGGTALVVAGAGGGACSVNGENGYPGLITTIGGNSSGAGGAGGNGGQKGYKSGDCGWAGGGGGFLGDGYGGPQGNDGGALPGTLGGPAGGKSRTNGGAGGVGGCCGFSNLGSGGWGCGGGGRAEYGGGGGGGYSGGGGGQYVDVAGKRGGGGGGSYNSGVSQTNTSGVQSGNGQVVITPIINGQTIYNYTGAMQTFTVPAGVTSINIVAKGAQGGGSEDCGGIITSDGGLGGSASGDLTVAPGQVLNIFVGRYPSTVLGGNSPGGYNGGGGAGQYGGPGGGASDVRLGGVALADRKVVAGGGGGGNTGCPDHGFGGVGGGLNGANGSGLGQGFTPGGGASQVAGGTAGSAPGAAGVLGIGAGTGNNYHEGAGGGGYYGGGSAYAAGGGGGSSFIGGVLNGVTTSGVNTGNGQIILTYAGGAGGAVTTIQTAGLASGATFPVGTTVNTFQVTDGLGNTASCSFNVIVVDNQVPTITCLGNITANTSLGVCGAVVNFNAPVGTDNCLSTTARTTGLASGSLFPLGATTQTYVVTDASGLTATCSFTVTVTDNQAPAITCPGNITVNNALGMCNAVVTFNAPVGTDNCSATTVRTAGLPSGSTFPVGVTTQSYTATDAAGNATSCSFTVTVVDNELPTVVCPANVATCNPLVTGIAPTSTNDNCAGTTVAYALTGATTGNGNTDASGTTFNVGTTSVKYTVTDAAGNTNNCSFNVVIHPTPVVVLSAFANDTICEGDAALALPNATPAGGTFSGAGVVGGNFNPATAGTGNHYVVYSSTNADGCNDIDSTMITVLVCAGIKGEANGSNIVVYPNPTSGMITITLGSMSKLVELTVTELNGQLVKSAKYANSNNVRMDISNLSDGMYFVTVKADNELKQVKIVKN